MYSLRAGRTAFAVRQPSVHPNGKRKCLAALAAGFKKRRARGGSGADEQDKRIKDRKRVYAARHVQYDRGSNRHPGAMDQDEQDQSSLRSGRQRKTELALIFCVFQQLDSHACNQ
jgi:hypothetical protein